MEHLGPGIKKNPEDIASDIMNQSDETVDDIFGGTEILDGDDAEGDYEDGESPADDYSDDSDYDDGGDFSDF